jgi:hypothetical protein
LLTLRRTVQIGRMRLRPSARIGTVRACSTLTASPPGAALDVNASWLAIQIKRKYPRPAMDDPRVHNSWRKRASVSSLIAADDPT